MGSTLDTRDEDNCSDPRRTRHSTHPNQPKNVSFSLRKIEERMAEMTTDRAPSGVCQETPRLVTMDRSGAGPGEGRILTDDDNRFDEGVRYGNGELEVKALAKYEEA